MAGEPAKLGSVVRESPIRDVQVVRVLNSPGPLANLRWDVRITYMDNFQQVYPSCLNSRIFPEIYSRIDLYGDGPGGDVAFRYDGDGIKLYFQCYPKLTECV